VGQSTTKKLDAKHSGPDNSHLIRGLRESALFVFGAIALYLTASLITYSASDPGWSHSESSNIIANAGGVAGAWFSDFFLYLFGYLAYLFPIMVAYSGWLFYAARNDTGKSFNLNTSAVRALGFILTISAGTGLAALHFGTATDLPLNSGGILGEVVGTNLVNFFSYLGTTLFLIALFLTGVSLFTSLSWIKLMEVIGRLTLGVFSGLALKWYSFRDNLAGKRAKLEREEVVKKTNKKSIKRKVPRIEPIVDVIEISDRVIQEKQIQLFEPSEGDESLPSLSLLDPPEVSSNKVSKTALEAISRQVELKLLDYGIEVHVVAVHPGPVVTRFELEPAPGVKASRITNLSKDLARSLSAISVRVVEVIPGKNTVGIEIPNESREIVRLSEVISSKQFDRARSPLTVALGKDIGGHPVVADLAKMPHLLVAGTTGSGKSVGINAMVISLLFNAQPSHVRMIMIDPKMLELSIYEGIPHLLAPVVTDMKEASNALRWCVAEMDRRYALMSHMGVRNLAGFNRKISDAIKAGAPIVDPTFKADGFLEEQEVRYLEELPSIVVVIDELADLMMVVGKKIEELIARLAQKARAAGVHLILATQRPSVDVLTGLIKANIPTRIAFQVSARVDSRTILDQGGAEQLLGHGDMLYLAPGTGIPTRVHGAYVSDQEVHRVVDELKSRGEPQYIEEILEGPDNIDASGYPVDTDSDEQVDELYDQAVAIVTETRKASISGVQRRLRIGYNRAARMVEEMERSGVVGPLASNGQREVLAPAPPRD